MAVIELDIMASNDPNGTPLVTLTDEDVSEFELRMGENELGGGSFTIRRDHPDATAANLAAGNYVKVTIPVIQAEPIMGFWLDEHNDTILSRQEEGGEYLTRAGPGTLAILGRAALLDEFYNDPLGGEARGNYDVDGYWTWSSEPYGAILVRLIEEGQYEPGAPLADVTIDFVRTLDSSGDAWPDIEELIQVPIGTDGLSLYERLIASGNLFVRADPDLAVHGYGTSPSVDRTSGSFGAGKVRFLKGTNIQTELVREARGANAATHAIVIGKDYTYRKVVSPLYAGGAGRWVNVDYQGSNDPDLLDDVGLENLRRRESMLDQLELEILTGDDPSIGQYLPIKHFDTGDMVTIHTGTDPWDYNEFETRLAGFRIVLGEASKDDTDLEAARSLRVIVELNGSHTTGFTGHQDGSGACCPPLAPYVPPGSTGGAAVADVTLSIGSAIYGYEGRTVHRASQVGAALPTIISGRQYRIVMTIIDSFNSPLQGYENTTYGFGITDEDAVPITNPTYGMTSSGDTDDYTFDGINVFYKSMPPAGTRTGGQLDPGFTFTGDWEDFSGPDTEADLYIQGTPSSGFYGGFVVARVRLEHRNGDGSPIAVAGGVGVPVLGQPTSEQIAGTTGGTVYITNFPYRTGSLVVHVGGVRVVPDETDADAGEFTLPVDATGGVVVVSYQVANGTSTGETNPAPSSTGLVPPQLLGTGSDGSGDHFLADDGTWKSGTTGSTWFDVRDYGATGDGTTDDTGAIQDAIDAAEAAGGGVVYFRKGVYVVGGALQDTSRSNSQLVLPIVDAVDGEQISIHLLGEFPPPPIFSVVGATPLPDEQVVIKGTLNTASGTSPSLLGGWGPSGSFEDFTFLQVRIENLTFRLPENPQLTALNLSHVTGVDLDNVVVDVSDYQIQGITEPTTAASFGIRLPALNNGAYTRLGAVNVAGYYKGIEVGEHTIGQQVSVWGCKQGIVTVAAFHASKFDRLMFVHCERGIVATGGDHYLTIDQLNVEHAASGWWVTDEDVDDANDYLHGWAHWKVTLAGTGHDSTWTVDGAANFHMLEIGEDPFGGSGLTPASTVEDETTWGITPAVGTDLEYARQDHTHGTPAEPSGSAGRWEVAMTDGITDPPEPIWTEDGTDWIYMLVDA